MKKPWIAVGLGLVWIFLALWIFRKQEGEPPSQPEMTKKEREARPEVRSMPEPKAESAGPDPALDEIEAANVPIVFSGKVVDENDLAVGGAAVRYRIKSVHPGNEEVDGRTSFEEKAVVSGNDGDFSIEGERGVLLTVLDISKEGYLFPADGRKDFGYSGFPEIHEDKKDAPMNFTLISLSSTAAVETRSVEITMPWNGRSARYSLETGARDPAGGLILQCSRTGRSGVFDWSVRMSVDGGGLLEVSEASDLVAPAEGYLAALEFGYKRDAQPWRFGKDVTVFYRRGGEYGRLRVQLCADAGADEVGAYVDRFWNKEGGRNTGISNSSDP